MAKTPDIVKPGALHPDYEKLPEYLKCKETGGVTEKEYLWLGQEGRRTLIEDTTTPEIADETGA